MRWVSFRQQPKPSLLSVRFSSVYSGFLDDRIRPPSNRRLPCQQEAAFFALSTFPVPQTKNTSNLNKHTAKKEGQRHLRPPAATPRPHVRTPPTQLTPFAYANLADLCQPMPTDAYTCRPVPTHAHSCLPMPTQLARAYTCMHPAHLADTCLLMPAQPPHAYICLHMFARAYTCFPSRTPVFFFGSAKKEGASNFMDRNGEIKNGARCATDGVF